MKKWSVVLAGVLVLAVTFSTAVAAGNYGKFLPPDQAFQLHADSKPNSIALNWRIANGYYLYRKKFRIVATNGAVGKARFPKGQTRTDPYFGSSVVYHHKIRVILPYKQIPADGKIVLSVTYQGCAEAGLCYPPITKKLDVPVTAAR